MAFPAISTGIFGYPLGPATGIAVAEAERFLTTARQVQNVIFACFGPEVLACYRAAGVTPRISLGDPITRSVAP